MIGTSLRTRATDVVELMDVPDCDPARLANTYRDFDRVNNIVSGWRGLYVRHLRPALQKAGPGAKILDIGCGGGDLLRRLVQWTKTDGFSPHFIGADPDLRAVQYARSESVPENVNFVCASASELVSAGERFHIVLSNHVLHHLADAEVVALCADSTRLATSLALHADIYRHSLAYAGFPLVGGWFRESFILEDGLLSIRRAFTPDELRRLIPSGWHVQAAFPFRLNLIWKA